MKKITIYTGPLCNYCDAAKRLLTRNNASYNEINIATIDGAMDEMIKKSNGKRKPTAVKKRPPPQTLSVCAEARSTFASNVSFY